MEIRVSLFLFRLKVLQTAGFVLKQHSWKSGVCSGEFMCDAGAIYFILISASLDGDFSAVLKCFFFKGGGGPCKDVLTQKKRADLLANDSLAKRGHFARLAASLMLFMLW